MKANGYNQAYTDSKTLLDYGFSVYKDNKVYTSRVLLIKFLYIRLI